MKERINGYKSLLIAIFGEWEGLPRLYPEIEWEALVSRCDQVLETLLDERMKRILRLRFGLDNGKPKGLEEVGREFGVTRERIRQIETKGLRILRHPSRSRQLREFIIPTQEEREREIDQLRELTEENQQLREENEELRQKDRRSVRQLKSLGIEEETFKTLDREAIAEDEQVLKWALEVVTAHYPKASRPSPHPPFREFYPSPLPTTVRNALIRAGISRLAQLKEAVETDQLRGIRHIGAKGREFIQEVLQLAEQQKASP